MRIAIAPLLIVTLIVSGCGLFGRNDTAALPTTENTNPLIPESTGVFDRGRNQVVVYPGLPVDTVTELSVERVPGGALIRAQGVAAVQGAYAVQLTPASPDLAPVDGVLTFRLEAIRPEKPLGVGTAASREVTAALRLTDDALSGVRTVRVEALQNAQTARR
ncbi:MAG: hypothetical protein AAF636_08870 [Pseudomonadota bacterium]